MIKLINRTLATRNLEEKLFLLILMGCLPFFMINFVVRILTSNDLIFPITYLVLLTTCATMLYFVWKKKYVKPLIAGFTYTMLAAFAIYMPLTSGPMGGASYLFQTVSILLLLINRGRNKVIVTTLLVSIILVFTNDLLEFQGVIRYDSLLSDYLVNLFFVALVMVFFKKEFDIERDKSLRTNNDLQLINKELARQMENLAKTNQEIEDVQHHLTEVINERTAVIKKENERIVEYAFINAHLVRAPIANILGFLELDDSKKLNGLKEKMLELDRVVKKIGGVLNR